MTAQSIASKWRARREFHAGTRAGGYEADSLAQDTRRGDRDT